MSSFSLLMPWFVCLVPLFNPCFVQELVPKNLDTLVVCFYTGGLFCAGYPESQLHFICHFQPMLCRVSYYLDNDSANDVCRFFHWKTTVWLQ